MSEPTPPPPAPANEWTVRKVLEWTTGHLKKHGSDTPRLDAEILLAHARGCKRIQLYTAYDETLTDTVRATMRELVQRRAQAEPVAYLVGHREFFSLDFRVTRDVLIPRPDTETLVLEIIDGIKQLSASRAAASDASPIRVIDLCTGSGCVAISVAKHALTSKLNIQVVATDISPAALAIARENATKHGIQDQIEFLEGDLFGALSSDRRFDIIASNPPYIATAEIDTLDPEVAKHEPRLALDGGKTGFDIIDRLIAAAPQHAAPNALFLMELSPEQADPAQQRLVTAGRYSDITARKDLSLQPRVLRAQIVTDAASVGG
ncbi:MAG: peptide chain release factor N(5)-glutamine methyltransferase [Planctomycetes bacterium]|nr:peptide chain release factor N(5)-glutamine methyltransferase [Planctomycetota bacterium]